MKRLEPRPGVTVGLLPSGYREGSAEQHCGNCIFGLPRSHGPRLQLCRMWWAPVRADMTCDRWDAR